MVDCSPRGCCRYRRLDVSRRRHKEDHGWHPNGETDGYFCRIRTAWFPVSVCSHTWSGVATLRNRSLPWIWDLRSCGTGRDHCKGNLWGGCYNSLQLDYHDRQQLLCFYLGGIFSPTHARVQEATSDPCGQPTRGVE